MMDAAAFHELVDSRRSIRAFRPDAVPDAVLQRCLDSALRAPSSSNLQHWEFILIRDPEQKRRAAAICHDQRGAVSAPLIVAVVAHRRTWKRHATHVLATLEARGILRKSQVRYWGRLVPLMYRNGPWGCFGVLKKLAGRLWSLAEPAHNLLSRADLRVVAHKSTALAAATFMLALRAEGYDSCPLEGFDPWRAKAFLGLGPGAEVCMFLPVGRRAEEGAIWWDRVLVPREWVVREL